MSPHLLRRGIYNLHDQPEKPTETPSGKIRLDSWAFLISMELLYSGKFLRVPNFRENPIFPPEEIFTVLIFAFSTNY